MTQEPEPDWSTRLTLSVAREVRRHRQAKGWSAQQLSDRCAEIGMPVQRSVLANLESGRRTTVTIAEIFVLAAALEVPPVSLMIPAGHEETFEGLPGAPGNAYLWAEWVTGEQCLVDPASKAAEAASAKTRLSANPLSQARVIRRAVDRYVYLFERYTKRLEQSLESVRANNRDLELYSKAMDEAESIVEQREALLISIKEGDDPEEMARASERRKALARESDAAFERVHALKGRIAAYHDDRQELEAYRLEVEEAKAAAASAVEAMVEAGWILPDLPVSLDDLREPLSSVL